MHTHSRSIYAERLHRVSKSTTRNAKCAICTASPGWAGAFAAKRIRFGSCNCACRCIHSPRGDSPKRSFHLRRIRRLWLHMAYAQRNGCKWEVVLNYRSLLKFSAWTVREESVFVVGWMPRSGTRRQLVRVSQVSRARASESCVAAHLSSTASAWGSPGEVAMSEV